MKIFVSWSGPLSQKVACALRDWIPCVLQYARPYVSSEDIDKGTRWSVDIAKELNDSSFGILCVTSDNQDAPWLNFEAGALSKAIDKSFVTPFLLNLKAAELRNGPLIQFQATTFAQDEVKKLIESINGKCGESERVEAATVRRTFEKWWPELDKELATILECAPQKAKPSQVPTKSEAMIEELLELARSQQRRVGNPEMLLPPEYLDWAFSRGARRSKIGGPTLFKRLHSSLLDVINAIEKIDSSESQKRAANAAEKLHTRFHELIDMSPFEDEFLGGPKLRVMEGDPPSSVKP